LDFEERSDDPLKKSPLKSEVLERILVRIIVEDTSAYGFNKPKQYQTNINNFCFLMFGIVRDCSFSAVAMKASRWAERSDSDVNKIEEESKIYNENHDENARQYVAYENAF